jgi:Leucine-rich repeat (LRR) protein
LNLSDNSLAAPVKGNGTESGHKVLRHLSGLSTLEKLNLSNNRFLVSLRSLKDLPALANLNLSNTGVTTEELDSFLKRIDAEFPSLITVTVTSSNKLICDDLTSVNSRYVVCQ